MITKRIQFPGADGSSLSGRLTLPPTDRPRAFALMAHCFTCGKDLNATRWIAEGLARRGYGVLRFDFTGLGESEGEFADSNFSSNVEDLVAAGEWLEREFEAPRLLVGHSLGGAAVLVAAAALPKVAAVAVIGAPSSTHHLAETLLEVAPDLEDEDRAQVQLAGRPFTVRRQFIDDLRHDRVLQAAADLDRPLLILHSPVDETVDVEHARVLYEAARHPKSFVSLDDADHLLLKRRGDAQYATDVLSAWAGRYLPDADDQDSDLEPGTVEVASVGSKFTNRVRTAQHDLVADEPAKVGGDDLGPGPFEFVLAGLGACTSMTLRMYADRKEWPLEGVEVRLTREKGEQDEPDRYVRRIHLDGDLSVEQRERLVEIAGRCPVHRSLEAGPEIVTELDSGSAD